MTSKPPSQTSLFESEAPDGRALVGVAGGSKTLDKAQREFNRLIEQVWRERERLAGW